MLSPFTGAACGGTVPGPMLSLVCRMYSGCVEPNVKLDLHFANEALEDLPPEVSNEVQPQ